MKGHAGLWMAGFITEVVDWKWPVTYMIIWLHMIWYMVLRVQKRQNHPALMFILLMRDALWDSADEVLISSQELRFPPFGSRTSEMFAAAMHAETSDITRIVLEFQPHSCFDSAFFSDFFTSKLKNNLRLLEFIEDESQPLENRKWIWLHYGTAYRATYTMYLSCSHMGIWDLFSAMQGTSCDPWVNRG